MIDLLSLVITDAVYIAEWKSLVDYWLIVDCKLQKADNRQMMLHG